METPFERLAKVLDNASANYLSESQRQQQLADQRQYAAGVLADERSYGETTEARRAAQKREQALIDDGYLTKPLGQNTAADIAAAVEKASANALAIRTDEDDTLKHAAAQRKREEEGWALNPLKSDERKAMEAAVDGGMINFGKPASKMTDEELAQANAEVKADAIKRAERGTQYATSIEQEIQQVRALTDPTPTAKELAQANAANPPKSSSIADRQAATQAAQQMAAQAALQRAALANVRLRDLSDTRDALIRSKQFPNEMPAAIGTIGTAKPTVEGAKPTEDFFDPIDAQSAANTAALGIDAETTRNRITEEVDNAWPSIESDYTLAALGDDAIREQINAPTTRTRLKPRSTLGLMAASPYDPNPAYEQEAYEDRPNAAEVDSRRLVLRDKQKAARGRLAKRRSQFEQYVPKTADAEQMRRAQIAKAILGLTGTEQAVTQNAFNSVAPTQ